MAVRLYAQAPHPVTEILHNFTAGTDGIVPFAGLTAGKNGILYGATEFGGAGTGCTDPIGCGAVFELVPPPYLGAAWSENVIYGFSRYSYPLASPTVGAGGKLYGSAYYGGKNSVGSVYELTPPSSPGGTWTETDLYDFSASEGDPQNPEAGLVIGKDGVLYGTVQFAGTSPNCPYTFSSEYGCGGVFSLTPPKSPGGSWREQMLYTFTSVPDALYPAAGPVVASDGAIYGTTRDGGDAGSCPQNPGCGVVFKLTPPSQSGEAWRADILYRFMADQAFTPTAGVVIGTDGNLFGTTLYGGAPTTTCPGGCGAVFEVKLNQANN